MLLLRRIGLSVLSFGFFVSVLSFGVFVSVLSLGFFVSVLSFGFFVSVLSFGFFVSSSPTFDLMTSPESLLCRLSFPGCRGVGEESFRLRSSGGLVLALEGAILEIKSVQEVINL